MELRKTETYSVQQMILEKKSKKKINVEKIIPKLLFLMAAISVFTTIGIILTLIFETFIFLTGFRSSNFSRKASGSHLHLFLHLESCPLSLGR